MALAGGEGRELPRSSSTSSSPGPCHASPRHDDGTRQIVGHGDFRENSSPEAAAFSLVSGAACGLATNAVSLRDAVSLAGDGGQRCQREKPAILTDASQAKVSQFQWRAVREQLSNFSEDILGLRQELRALQVAEAQLRRELAAEAQERQESLADALDVERRERAAAFERCRARAAELTFAVDEERAQRVAAFESLGHEVHRAWMALEDEARKRLGSVSELSVAQEKEMKDRVTLEVSVHQALQLMHADFQKDQEERAKAIEQERHDRLQDFDCVKKIIAQEEVRANARLIDMQASIDQACQCMQGETASLGQALHAEAKARGCGDDEMRQRLAEIRAQLEDDSRQRRERDEQLTNEFSKTVSLRMEQEAQERTAGDAEAARATRLVRQSTERAERETKAFEEEANRRFVELTTTLSHERGERERLESELHACRQDALLQRKERAEEETVFLRDLDGERDARTAAGSRLTEEQLRLAEEIHSLRSDVEALHGSLEIATEKGSRCQGTVEEAETLRRELRALEESLRRDMQVLEVGLRHERDALDTTLKEPMREIQTIRAELVQEKKERGQSDIDLRELCREIVQGLEVQTAHHLNDLRDRLREQTQERIIAGDELARIAQAALSAAEQETLDRRASDEEASARVAEMRRSLEEELLHASQKIWAELQSIRRAEPDADLHKMCKEIAGGLCSLEAQTSHQAKELRDRLQVETQERARADEEVARLAQAAARDSGRVLAESEERASADEEVARFWCARLAQPPKQDSSRSEVLEQTLEDSGPTSATVRDICDECLRGHELQMMRHLKDLRDELEKACQDLCSEATLKLQVELQASRDSETYISQKLPAVEASGIARNAADLPLDAGTESIQRLWEKMDTDSQYHAKQVSELSEWVRTVAEGFEQDIADRQSGISGLRAQLASCLRELVAERDERVSEVAALREGMRSLEGQVSRHLEELRMLLESKFFKRNTLVGKIVDSPSSGLLSSSHTSLTKEQSGEVPTALRIDENVHRAKTDPRVGISPVAAQNVHVAAECMQAAAASDSNVLKRVKSDPYVGVNLGMLERVRLEMEVECNERARAVQDLSHNLKALSGELGIKACLGGQVGGGSRENTSVDGEGRDAH